MFVQEMAKRVASEDKAHDANEIRKHAEHETRWEKNVSNIPIHNEKNKAYDIMKDVQFMMKDSHAKQWSHQRRVGLLMFFHKNERQLEKSNHDNLISHIQT